MQHGRYHWEAPGEPKPSKAELGVEPKQWNAERPAKDANAGGATNKEQPAGTDNAAEGNSEVDVDVNEGMHVDGDDEADSPGEDDGMRADGDDSVVGDGTNDEAWKQAILGDMEPWELIDRLQEAQEAAARKEKQGGDANPDPMDVDDFDAGFLLDKDENGFKWAEGDEDLDFGGAE